MTHCSSRRQTKVSTDSTESPLVCGGAGAPGGAATPTIERRAALSLAAFFFPLLKIIKNYHFFFPLKKIITFKGKNEKVILADLLFPVVKKKLNKMCLHASGFYFI